MPTMAVRFGSEAVATPASITARMAWVAEMTISRRRRSKLSASRPPIIEKNSIGPSWAKSTMPTNDDDLVRS